MHLISYPWLEMITAILFIMIGFWVLIPDKEQDMASSSDKQFGAFTTTVIAFFIAEMGDKTQFATMTLGAAYHDIVMVTIGTTAGMLAANVLGDKLLNIIPLDAMRMIASGLFIGFAVFTLITLM